MQSSNSPFMQSYQELPSTVAIFPLSGVVLLPRARLPLNIFEPRYLNMIQDAMQGQRLIGMIQPSSDQSDDLQQVGCAGRITHYAETNDGRLEIILSGLCRFRIAQELPTVRGYRLVQPDWEGFAADYQVQTLTEQELATFRAVLQRYLQKMEIDADWSGMQKLDSESLISNLVMALPLDATDKQLLIEASDLQRRAQLLSSLLELSEAQQEIKH